MKRLKFILIICGLSVIVAGGLFAPASAIKTLAELNSKLRYGMDTPVAMDWDNSAHSAVYRQASCRDNIRNEGYASEFGDALYGGGSYGPGIGSSGVGASYRFDNWLSARGQGNVSSPITILRGTTVIDLQINSLSFTCRPLANPIPDPPGLLGSCSLTGTDWTNTGGWVNNTSVADTSVHIGSRDYGTNTSNSCFLNIKSWQHIKIYSMSGSGGSVTRIVPTNDELNVERDVSSRYWIADPNEIRYTASAPINSDTDITINYEYKQQNNYTNGTTTCIDKDNPTPLPPTPPGPLTYADPTAGTAEVNWGECYKFSGSLTVSLRVVDPPQWEISGTTTGSGNPVVGGTLTWNHQVRNDGPDATDKPVDMKVYRTINGSPPAVMDTEIEPSGSPTGSIGGPWINTYTAVASDIGKTICEYVGWVPSAGNNDGASKTTPVCYTIGAYPRLSIIGADAASGGAVVEPCVGAGGFKGSTESNPKSFGEYGLMSTNAIDNFSSSGISDSKSLSFANTGTPAPSTAGYYTDRRCILDLATRLTTNVTFTNINNVGSISFPGAGNWRLMNDLDIGGGPMGANQHRLIYAPDKIVTISNDIYHDSATYNSFKEVPSLVIIAKKIRILGEVDRIDGVFVASETVSTCQEAGDSVTDAIGIQFIALITGGACRKDQPLVINGAILAGEFTPARSSLGNPGSDPAEIVRFRPEIFLGPFERSVTGVTLKTDTETELPPRN